MGALDIMEERHSYRGRYKDIPVPEEDLVKIMKAGLSAPSGCNQQTVSLIAVTEKELLEQIGKILPVPAVVSAPDMIVVLSEYIVSYHGNCYSVQDYSAAIENMLLMITDLGYQSCWYEGYVQDERKLGERIAEVLDVPSHLHVVCILPVGYAKEEVKKVKKKPFEERAWLNGYGGKRE